MRRFPLAILMTLLPCLPVSGQEEKLVESIEVRVTNVDVVVTDKAGNPIPGLTRDDFVLYENRKPQPISNFYEVKPAAALPAVQSTASTPAVVKEADVPAEVRRRRVVFFIDNYSLHPLLRNEVFASVNRFFDGLLQPDDEAMIATFNRRLNVVQPFTTNHARLKEAIAEVTGRSSGGPNIEASRNSVKAECLDLLNQARQVRSGMSIRSAYDQSISIVRAHAEEVYSAEKQLAEAMNLMIASLAGVDGKKVMVFAGAQLPAQPALDLFQWLDQSYAPYLQGFIPSAVANANERSMLSQLEKVAKRANANGVTLYMIDGAEATRGLTSSPESTEPGDPSEGFLDLTNTAITYDMMAKMTGGVALMRTHNFDQALSTVARDLGYYYSLGYHPEGSSTADRALRVTVKNPAYRVRSRRTYVSKSAEEQVNDRVVANVFHSEVQSDTAITISTGPPLKQRRNVWRVPVRLLIPPTITLLPQGDLLVGGFNVFIAVGDSHGAMSPVSKIPQSIKIPPAAEAALRKRPWIFNAVIDVAGGEHYLSIAVVDQITNTSGFVRTKIIAR
jgi:VWFA-related protein